MSYFNGGRSQVNPNLPQVGGDFPFVNLFLWCQFWGFADSTGWPAPNTLDANGYPKTLTNGGVSTVFAIPTQAQRSGDYYLITTGKGTLNGTGFSVTVSGTDTQTLVSAASLAGVNSITLNIIATDATTPISKIAFVHDQDRSTYFADNLAFGQKFISILQQGNCGVIRFLNWQNGNFSNETTWSTRKPLTYFSFDSNEFPNQRADAGLGCQVGFLGQTTSVVNDYAISDSIGTHAPVHGQIILVNFDAPSVTVTSGANAQIAWTGHGLQTGFAFCMYSTPANVGGAPPGGVTIWPDPLGTGGPTTFYAIVVDANHIKFATTYANAIANTAITTTSTGSGLSAHATVVASNAVLTASGTNVAWAHHQTVTGDPVMISGACPATNISAGITYYSIVVDADNVKFATTKANAISNTAITFAGGGTVQVTRQPTLNLNGTGAVPIRDKNSSGCNVNNNNAPQARAYQSQIVYGALRYDAGLNIWIKTGADQADTVYGFGSSVPPEVCLKLCIAVGAHAYFVSPWSALEPMTDYMPSLMQYCHDTAPAWMIPRFEIYNEDWNTTPGTSYGQYKTWVNWAIQEGFPHNWVGKTGSTLGQAAAVVWPGGKGVNYQILIGVQTSPFNSPANAALNNNRVAAAQYVGQVAAAQSPLTGSWGTITFTKTPAYQWATHICCAQYITPTLWGTNPGVTPNESDMAHTWTVNGSLPNDPLLNQYVDSLAGPTDNRFNMAANFVCYQQIFIWAQGAGVSGGWGGAYKLKMCGYEGGYSPSLQNTGPPNLGEVYKFRNASKMVADVGPCIAGGTLSNATVVNGTYNDFTAAGGEFPSCFQLSGPLDGWAVLDPDIYVTPQPAQWTAIVNYNYVAPQVGNYLRYKKA